MYSRLGANMLSNYLNANKLADDMKALSTAQAMISFSPDGTSILFVSRASDLVPGDTNGDPDYFIKNLVTGAVTRVSTGTIGPLASRTSQSPSANTQTSMPG